MFNLRAIKRLYLEKRNGQESLTIPGGKHIKAIEFSLCTKIELFIC